MDHRLTLSTANADEKPKIVLAPTRIHSLWSDPSPQASSHIYNLYTPYAPGPPFFPVTPNISPEANPAASRLSISAFAYLHPSPLSPTPRGRVAVGTPTLTQSQQGIWNSSRVCPCFSPYTARSVR